MIEPGGPCATDFRDRSLHFLLCQIVRRTLLPGAAHERRATGELCNSLCPASKTKVFSGSDINYATASDGTRYSSLENAFVYLEKVVDGCTSGVRWTGQGQPRR